MKALEIKQLLIDLSPLGAVLGSVSLVNIHHAVSIGAILLSAVYTIFKIRKDFFKKEK